MTTLWLAEDDWQSAARDLEHRVRGEAYRHLIRARRLEIGEAVRLTDGHGRARWSDLVRFDRREAVLRLRGDAPAGEPGRWVELLVAMPKAERAAWLVEKAAELGARRLCFLSCERAPRSPGAAALARLRRVARAALEQSEGAWMLELPPPVAWRAALGAPPLEREIVLSPDGAAPASALAATGAARLWVGPEGGWTAAELEAIRARGAAALSLGPRILRVETAAVVALALALAPSR